MLASDWFIQTCELHVVDREALEHELINPREGPFLTEVPKERLWGDAWSTELTHTHPVYLLAHVQGSSEPMGHHNIRCLRSSG